MGPVGNEAMPLRELLVLDAVLEEVGVGGVDVGVGGVRLERALVVVVGQGVVLAAILQEGGKVVEDIG